MAETSNKLESMLDILLTTVMPDLETKIAALVQKAIETELLAEDKPNVLKALVHNIVDAELKESGKHGILQQVIKQNLDNVKDEWVDEIENGTIDRIVDASEFRNAVKDTLNDMSFNIQVD